MWPRCEWSLRHGPGVNGPMGEAQASGSISGQVELQADMELQVWSRYGAAGRKGVCGRKRLGTLLGEAGCVP